MGTMIERRGVEDTLEGFDFYMTSSDDPIYYSIWHGQKLKHTSRLSQNDGAREEFETMLRVWQNSGTGGVLEVRFHEVKPNDKINNKTAYFGSYGFTMEDNRIQPHAAVSGVPMQQNPVSSIQNLVSQIQALEQLKTMLFPGAMAGESPVYTPEPPTWWDKIKTVLDMPVTEDIIAGIAEKWLGLNMSGFKEQQMAGDNLQQTDMDVTTMEFDLDLEQDQEARLRAALATIAHKEKNFVELMEKLAKLKQENPSKYNMAKMFL